MSSDKEEECPQQISKVASLISKKRQNKSYLKYC